LLVLGGAVRAFTAGEGESDGKGEEEIREKDRDVEP